MVNEVETRPTIGAAGNDQPRDSPAAKAAALIEAQAKAPPPTTEPVLSNDTSAGWAPKKQQQFDEATAPIDDQERRAVQRRLQRQSEEDRAKKGLATGRSTTGAQTPTTARSGKLTWRARASGYLSSRGLVSSRSTGGTARSMMSTSRSMMTTCRSDMATGRYNDVVGKEITETRSLEIDIITDSLEDDARRRRAGAHAAGASNRTGKTPRSAAKTAAALRANLARRAQGKITGRITGRKAGRV